VRLYENVIVKFKNTKGWLEEINYNIGVKQACPISPRMRVINCPKDNQAAHHMGICQLTYATSQIAWEGRWACKTSLMSPLLCSPVVSHAASYRSLNAHSIPASMHSAVEFLLPVLGVSLNPSAGVHRTVNVQSLYGYWEVLLLPS